MGWLFCLHLLAIFVIGFSTIEKKDLRKRHLGLLNEEHIYHVNGIKDSLPFQEFLEVLVHTSVANRFFTPQPFMAVQVLFSS